MNWVKALAAVLVLWSTTAWGATLTWNADGAPDLGGYHVYQCSQQPCAKSSGTATLLATLGKVTSFDIGTPVVVQYYVITAYDFANNESSQSNVATYLPTGASTPPPAATVSLTVLGSPNLGYPWSVQATPHGASGTVSVQVWINGALDHTEGIIPYCPFGDDGVSCTRVQKPSGYYMMEFRVLSNGTEVARQALIVTATAVPPAATVSLTVVGSPNLGQPWSVQATPYGASGTVSVQVWINGALDHTEGIIPYCPFGDDGVSCTRVQKPSGYYMMEFRVLSNGTEVARQATVVTAT